jgi:hypothetical protein
MIRFPVAEYVGTDAPVTFITHVPQPGQTVTAVSPYDLLYDRIVTGLKRDLPSQPGGWDSEWTRHLGKPTIRGVSDSEMDETKVLKKPTEFGWVRAFVMQNGTKQEGCYYSTRGMPMGAALDDPPTVVRIAKGAVSKLTAKLAVRNPQMEEDPNLDRRFVHPNLFGGKFVIVHDAKVPSSQWLPPKIDPKTGRPVRPFGPQGPQAHETGYAVDIEPTVMMNGYALQASKIFSEDVKESAIQFEKMARNRYVKWNDVIHIPEPSEVCIWLIQAFESEPEMLAYAWNGSVFLDDSSVADALERQLSAKGKKSRGMSGGGKKGTATWPSVENGDNSDLADYDPSVDAFLNAMETQGEGEEAATVDDVPFEADESQESEFSVEDESQETGYPPEDESQEDRDDELTLPDEDEVYDDEAGGEVPVEGDDSDLDGLFDDGELDDLPPTKVASKNASKPPAKAPPKPPAKAPPKPPAKAGPASTGPKPGMSGPLASQGKKPSPVPPSEGKKASPPSAGNRPSQPLPGKAPPSTAGKKPLQSPPGKASSTGRKPMQGGK